MKKVILALLLPLIFLSFSGCSYDMSRKEIDEIDLILVLGMDYKDGEFVLSALYSPGSGEGGSGGGGDKSESDQGSEQLATGKGKTAYEALRDLGKRNKKAISLAQTGTFLIGEDAAKQGLSKCLDFLSRDETIKMESLIYVTKGMSASDFIKIGQENRKTIHEDLEAMKQKQREVLTRNDNTMVNILNEMKQTLSCVMIPYMTANDSGYLIEGYTVFDKLAFKDYLDQETSDGVNFFRNLVKTYPIYLDDQIGLQITYTSTKIKADLRKRKITITIKVSFETMIKEMLTDNNVLSLEKLEQMTSQQNDYIRNILMKPVEYSVRNGLDILNLARVVENQNVSAWREVKEDWPQLISEINYHYELQSRISKSFILGTE